MGYMSSTLEATVEFSILANLTDEAVTNDAYLPDPSVLGVDPEQFRISASSNKRNNAPAPAPATPTHHSLAEDLDVQR